MKNLLLFDLFFPYHRFPLVTFFSFTFQKFNYNISWYEIFEVYSIWVSFLWDKLLESVGLCVLQSLGHFQPFFLWILLWSHFFSSPSRTLVKQTVAHYIVPLAWNFVQFWKYILLCFSDCINSIDLSSIYWFYVWLFPLYYWAIKLVVFFCYFIFQFYNLHLVGFFLTELLFIF